MIPLQRTLCVLSVGWLSVRVCYLLDGATSSLCLFLKGVHARLSRTRVTGMRGCSQPLAPHVSSTVCSAALAMSWWCAGRSLSTGWPCLLWAFGSLKQPAVHIINLSSATNKPDNPPSSPHAQPLSQPIQWLISNSINHQGIDLFEYVTY